RWGLSHGHGQTPYSDNCSDSKASALALRVAPPDCLERRSVKRLQDEKLQLHVREAEPRRASLRAATNRRLKNVNKSRAAVVKNWRARRQSSAAETVDPIAHDPLTDLIHELGFDR
ncbi:hypothetical protein, partial [Mycobacterium avium]